MKLSLDRSSFLSSLQLVARATATRSAIQALSGILLTAEGDVAELAATDTEIGLRAPLEGTVEQPGRALVPGRLLVEIVRALDTAELSLEYKVDKREMEVSAGQSRFVIKGLASEDFPHLPQPPGDNALKVPANVFATTVDRVARAASRDETRPVLTGILVSVLRATFVWLRPTRIASASAKRLPTSAAPRTSRSMFPPVRCRRRAASSRTRNPIRLRSLPRRTRSSSESVRSCCRRG